MALLSLKHAHANSRNFKQRNKSGSILLIEHLARDILKPNNLEAVRVSLKASMSRLASGSHLSTSCGFAIVGFVMQVENNCCLPIFGFVVDNTGSGKGIESSN